MATKVKVKLYFSIRENLSNDSNEILLLELGGTRSLTFIDIQPDLSHGANA